MIAYIKGKIIRKNITSIIIETSGLGYEVYVSLNNLHKYQLGEEVALVTYLHIREDLMQLYGFEDWEERDIFLLLINVSGVGPKGAMAILSHISIEQLKIAIATENLDVLTKLPGIGKKTAQRLLIELKDKMPVVPNEYEAVTGVSTVVGNELVEVLVSLGYQPLEVKKIIPQLLRDNPDADESVLIKKALQVLAKI